MGSSQRYRLAARLSIAALVLSSSLFGQAPPSLFSEIFPESADEAPAPEVASRREVVIDLELLMSNPPALTVELPSIGEVLTAERSLFEARAGFDPDGRPLPGVPENEIALLWRGKRPDDSLTDVVLTVVGGVLSGLVIGPEIGQFAIEKALSGDFLLEMIPEQMATEDPVEAVPFQATGVSRAPPPQPRRLATAAQPAVIDLLFLYTEAARQESGANPFDTADTAPLVAAMQRSVDELNAAFENSGIAALGRIVHVGRLEELAGLEDFVPRGNTSADRDFLQGTSSIWELRRQVDADLVSVVLRPSGALFPACGIAFTQRPSCSDFGSGRTSRITPCTWLPSIASRKVQPSPTKLVIRQDSSTSLAIR